MAAGVPLGMKNAHQPSTVKSVRPCSYALATFGKIGERSLLKTANALTVPSGSMLLKMRNSNGKPTFSTASVKRVDCAISE
jgi:hypothetical protein